MECSGKLSYSFCKCQQGILESFIMSQFTFHDPGRLLDGDLELVLVKTNPYDSINHWVPDYHFEMRHPGQSEVLGTIRLRIGSPEEIKYCGHIGYDVREQFRGNHYAERSCHLLFPLAFSHGLKQVFLNVDPNNLPSIRTCERLGSMRLETIHIKKDHPTYSQGTRYHRRYVIDL
jgi:predicted acetyltransferase